MMTGVYFPAGQDFSLYRNVQTGPAVQPVPCPVCTGFLSFEVKWLGHEADH
jgi:hypothetical protein